MDVLYHIIIALAVLAASPFILLKMTLDPAFAKDVRARLAGGGDAPKLTGPIWIHASSVGEVRAAKLMIQALKRLSPPPEIALSTFTRTGFELAREDGLEPAFRMPPDSPLWLGPLFGRLNPSVLVLVEAELWPGLLRACHKRGVPVVLVNGRLSQKSLGRYRLARPVFRWITAGVRAFAMRGEADAQRLLKLGIERDRVWVTGNVKFDQPTPAVQETAKEDGEPLVVFGSTRPGDEAIVLKALKLLSQDIPRLRAVIAPRHMERLSEVESLLMAEGLAFKRLSEAGPADPPPGEILLLDRLGELASFYPRAQVAFVGGSFDPGIGGHNILEPAAAGVPVVFGKQMHSFEEEARLLIASGGGIALEHPEDLHPTLRRLLADADERNRRGARARETVLQHRGSVDRNVELIARFRLSPAAKIMPGVRTIS
ncbi:MAG: glycosyltransferase [Nitrospinaceae bacterium]|nr:MAG: glycosyltransferase [Nitrospinaceae bacterium]